MARKGDINFGTDRVAKPTKESGDSTQQSPALATLVQVVNGAEGLVHPLLGDHFVIGRGKDCHIRIEGDTSVSRKHASITRRGVQFIVEDLGSSNGIYVNGKKVEGAHELKVGDTLEVGAQAYVFKRRV
ncbi:MAG: FHA domain-containing protein [Planctomycetes bacterium]|nr:FHA domain-containing protein [Planctomycetota bacterium]MCW8134336.1 FHA domain-containing protein [Planctomycetota bacterium]